MTIAELTDEIPALAAEAKAAEASGHGPEADRLWAAVFRLPRWLFLMSPKSVETSSPSVQLIEHRPWLLVFSNADLLQRYAVTNKNLDASGNALFLSIPNAGVLPYLEGFREAGVFGVRFNEWDDAGFYAPLPNLAAFPRYLRDKGFLPRGQSLPARPTRCLESALADGAEASLCSAITMSATSYRCAVCSSVYDPAEGDAASGVPAGTPFQALPADWVCPDCGAPKADFEPSGDA